MKKSAFLVLVALVASAYVVKNILSNQEDQLIRSRLIIDKQGAPTPALKELLDIFHVEHDGTLKGIVAATQKAWIRKPGTERWELTEEFADKRDQVLPLFQRLGTVDAINPTQKKYTYAVLFGATLKRVRTRFAHLLELHNQGTQFDRIIFLGGKRPLNQELESPEQLRTNTVASFPFKSSWSAEILPTTELEMMKMVYEQAELSEEFQKIPVDFIDSPMKVLPDGTVTRPQTGDTVLAWLATNPIPGSCLCISNQPYVPYQDSVARTYIPTTFTIETVGEAMNPNITTADLLDNLARTLYQELQQRK